MEKYGTAGQATDDNKAMGFASWIPKATNKHNQLIFHCNNGCANAPQREVTLTLTVLFICTLPAPWSDGNIKCYVILINTYNCVRNLILILVH
jgi:hypothetical protein